MKRRLVVLLLVVTPLAIAACGGAGATPRTAAGVRSDYVQFAKLVSAGNGAAACSRYVAPTVIAETAVPLLFCNLEVKPCEKLSICFCK